jgi:hypothetical protein
LDTGDIQSFRLGGSCVGVFRLPNKHIHSRSIRLRGLAPPDFTGYGNQ